jgi:hypothetical protein
LGRELHRAHAEAIECSQHIRIPFVIKAGLDPQKDGHPSTGHDLARLARCEGKTHLVLMSFDIAMEGLNQAQNVCFNNGYPPAKVPLSAFAVSQANASRISRINPIPLEPGQQSYMPANSAVDPENHMMYVPDGGAGKLTGLKYNPMTGNMSVVWRANQSTLAFFSLIGPANHRVLVGTNMHPGTTVSQM